MYKCSDCEVIRTPENTYLVKPTKGSPYLRSRCNTCHARKQRQYGKNNKAACNERSRVWRKTNPQRHTYLTTLYKKHVKRATPSWLTEAQLEEIAYFYYIAKEAKLTSGEVYHVDHIIPLRGELVCGLHVPWNLQVLPADVNIRKSNRTVV